MSAMTASTLAESDDRLVAALRLREPRAAERLVSTYQARAHRLALAITGNPQDAEEVVQDAFSSVIGRIDTFRGEAALGSWLHRIVVNAAYGLLRRRRCQRGEVALDAVPATSDERSRPATSAGAWRGDGDDAAHRIELRLALASSLGALPAHYRAILLLRDVEGRSSDEVASALGISVGSAKSRVHRARVIIRKHLAKALGVADGQQVLREIA
jgi:RNA polymerase sigma-70 factor (ECF subfamily)